LALIIPARPLEEIMSEPGHRQPSPSASVDGLMQVYKDVCDNIRVTDDISFKLLGAVPAVSGVGSGILAFLGKDAGTDGTETAYVILALLGAAVTLGLFRWELRNIQKCKWLIACAARLEEKLFPHATGPQFRGMASKEDLGADALNRIKVASISDRPWGKTQSVRLIYSAAVVAWLVPVGIAIWTAM
jgi:hypothetical protein